MAAPTQYSPTLQEAGHHLRTAQVLHRLWEERLPGWWQRRLETLERESRHSPAPPARPDFPRMTANELTLCVRHLRSIVRRPSWQNRGSFDVGPVLQVTVRAKEGWLAQNNENVQRAVQCDDEIYHGLLPRAGKSRLLLVPVMTHHVPRGSTTATGRYLSLLALEFDASGEVSVPTGATAYLQSGDESDDVVLEVVAARLQGMLLGQPVGENTPVRAVRPGAYSTLPSSEVTLLQMIVSIADDLKKDETSDPSRSRAGDWGTIGFYGYGLTSPWDDAFMRSFVFGGPFQDSWIKELLGALLEKPLRLATTVDGRLRLLSVSRNAIQTAGDRVVHEHEVRESRSVLSLYGGLLGIVDDLERGQVARQGDSDTHPYCLTSRGLFDMRRAMLSEIRFEGVRHKVRILDAGFPDWLGKPNEVTPGMYRTALNLGRDETRYLVFTPHASPNHWALVVVDMMPGGWKGLYYDSLAADLTVRYSLIQAQLRHLFRGRDRFVKDGGVLELGVVRNQGQRNAWACGYRVTDVLDLILEHVRCGGTLYTAREVMERKMRGMSEDAVEFRSRALRYIGAGVGAYFFNSDEFGRLVVQDRQAGEAIRTRA